MPLPLQDNVTEKFEQMVKEGNLEPIQTIGATNASPVVLQRKAGGEMRLCVDLKMHMKGKIMDEDYPMPDMETILHYPYGASYIGKNGLSDAKYQTELDDEG